MSAFASRPKRPGRQANHKALLFLLALLPLSACNAPRQPTSQPPVTPYNHEPDRRSREDRKDRREENYREGRRREEDNRSRGEGSGRSDNGASPRHRNGSARNNTPGSFDFYLLNLSWSPEYCYAHRDSPECAAHSTFVLHGLWPQNNDGSYPSECSEAPGPADPGIYASLYPSTGLLQHEWREHGTCTGLTPDAYLAAARHAVQSVSIPPKLEHLPAATGMSPQQILGLFQASNPDLPAASLALSCGNNFLTAVEVCFDKDLHPTACQQIRSCRAGSVRIPAP